MNDPTFIQRVRLQNYKSIRRCDVRLGPLTFLVGPNGAGKSNFVDALRFVADSLNTTIDHALRDRGGINEVRRRSGGHPNNFSIRLDFRLPSGQTGHYAFQVAAQPRGGFKVHREECVVIGPDALGEPASFKVEGGEARSTVQPFPRAIADRLSLVAASSLEPFRPVFDALTGMGFYNLNPGQIRELQPPDPGVLLARDGSNLPSVIGELGSHDASTKRRVEEYLSKIVTSVRGVDKKVIASRETLEFRQEVAGASHPWRFNAVNMSDGTLRALGILVALFQGGDGEGAERHASLVGIEEPEVALHPAAAGVLLDALTEASSRVQVLVTSHSPDLLDSKEIPTESILAVDAMGDVSVVGPVDEAGRSALRDRLFTPGELLRMGQLEPETPAAEDDRQPRLFELA